MQKKTLLFLLLFLTFQIFFARVVFGDQEKIQHVVALDAGIQAQAPMDAKEARISLLASTMLTNGVQLALGETIPASPVVPGAVSTQTGATLATPASKCTKELITAVDTADKQYEKELSTFMQKSDLNTVEIALRLKATIPNLRTQLLEICKTPLIMGDIRSVALTETTKKRLQNLEKQFPVCATWRNTSVVTDADGIKSQNISTESNETVLSVQGLCQTYVDDKIIPARDDMMDTIPIWDALQKRTELFTGVISDLNISLQVVNDTMAQVNINLRKVRDNTKNGVVCSAPPSTTK